MYSLETFAQVLEEELDKLPENGNALSSNLPPRNSAITSKNSSHAGSPDEAGGSGAFFGASQRAVSMVDLQREETAMREYLDNHKRSGSAERILQESNGLAAVGSAFKRKHNSKEGRSAPGTPGIPGGALATNTTTYYRNGFNPYCPHKISGKPCNHDHGKGGNNTRSSSSHHPGRRTRAKPFLIPPPRPSQADVVLMRGYVARMIRKLREGLRRIEREDLNREHKHEVQTLLTRFEQKEKAKEADFVERQELLQESLKSVSEENGAAFGLLARYQNFVRGRMPLMLGGQIDGNVMRAAFHGWKDVTLAVKHELFALQIAKTVHVANKHRHRTAVKFRGRTVKMKVFFTWKKERDQAAKQRALLYCVDQAKAKMGGAFSEADMRTKLVIIKLWRADTEKELIITKNNEMMMEQKLQADKAKLESIQRSMANLAMRSQAKGAEAEEQLLSWTFQCWFKELKQRKEKEAHAWDRWNLRIKQKRQHIKTWIVKAWGDGLDALRREARMEEWNNKLVKRFKKDADRDQKRELFDAWGNGIKVMQEEEREALRLRQEALLAQGHAQGEKAKENALQKWEGRAVKQRFYLGWKSIWEKLGLRNRAIQSVCRREQKKRRLIIVMNAWSNCVRETREHAELQRTHLEYQQQTAMRLMSYIGGASSKQTDEVKLKIKTNVLKYWKKIVINEKKIRKRIKSHVSQCKEDFFIIWQKFCVVSFTEYNRRAEKACRKVLYEKTKKTAAVCFKMWGVYWRTRTKMRARFVEHKEYFQAKWDHTVSLKHAFHMWRFTKVWSAQLRAAKDAANLTMNGVSHLKKRKGLAQKYKIFKEWSMEIDRARVRAELNAFHGDRMQMMMNKMCADMQLMVGPNRCFAVWKKQTEEGKTQDKMVEHLYKSWMKKAQMKQLMKAIRAWRDYATGESNEREITGKMSEFERLNAEHGIFKVTIRWEAIVQKLLDRNGDALLKMITQQSGEMKLKLAETKYELALNKCEVLQETYDQCLKASEDLSAWRHKKDTMDAFFMAWRTRGVEAKRNRKTYEFQKKCEEFMKFKTSQQEKLGFYGFMITRIGMLNKCWRGWLEEVQLGRHEAQLAEKNMLLLQERQGRIRKMFFAMGAQDEKLMKTDAFASWLTFLRKERRNHALERYVYHRNERFCLRRHLELWASSVFDMKGNRLLENRKHDYKFSLSCLVRKNSGVQNRYLLLVVWRAWYFHYTRSCEVNTIGNRRGGLVTGNVDRVLLEARDLRERNRIGRQIQSRGLDASVVRSQYFNEYHYLREGYEPEYMRGTGPRSLSPRSYRDHMKFKRKVRIKEHDEPGKYYADMWDEGDFSPPNARNNYNPGASNSSSLKQQQAIIATGHLRRSSSREPPAYRIHVVPSPEMNDLRAGATASSFVNSSHLPVPGQVGRIRSPLDFNYQVGGSSSSRSRSRNYGDQDATSRGRTQTRRVKLATDTDSDEDAAHTRDMSPSQRRGMLIKRFFENQYQKSFKLNVEKRLGVPDLDIQHDTRFEYLLDLHELEGLQYLFDSHPSACGGFDVTLALLKRLITNMQAHRVFKGEVKNAHTNAKRDNLLMRIGLHAFMKNTQFAEACQTELVGDVRLVEEVRDSVVQTGPMERDVEIVFMPQPPGASGASGSYHGRSGGASVFGATGSTITTNISNSALESYNRDRAYLRELRTYLGYVADELSHRLRLAAGVSGAAPQTSLSTATNILTWLSQLVEKFRHPDLLGDLYGTNRKLLGNSSISGAPFTGTTTNSNAFQYNPTPLGGEASQILPYGSYSFSASGPGQSSPLSPRTKINPGDRLKIASPRSINHQPIEKRFIPLTNSKKSITNASVGTTTTNTNQADLSGHANNVFLSTYGISEGDGGSYTGLAYKSIRSNSKEWEKDVTSLLTKASLFDTVDAVAVPAEIASSSSGTRNAFNYRPGQYSSASSGAGGMLMNNNAGRASSSSSSSRPRATSGSKSPPSNSAATRWMEIRNSEAVGGSKQSMTNHVETDYVQPDARAAFNYLNYKTQAEREAEMEQYRLDVERVLDRNPPVREPKPSETGTGNSRSNKTGPANISSGGSTALSFLQAGSDTWTKKALPYSPLPGVVPAVAAAPSNSSSSASSFATSTSNTNKGVTFADDMIGQSRTAPADDVLKVQPGSIANLLSASSSASSSSSAGDIANSAVRRNSTGTATFPKTTRSRSGSPDIRPSHDRNLLPGRYLRDASGPPGEDHAVEAGGLPGPNSSSTSSRTPSPTSGGAGP
ncbi:unnamed protein product [Amoebophrya sp. A120]|nr:unnamed protein product [Amoebophrya sp. A120]|eukprot:GSA120T00025189001.1